MPNEEAITKADLENVVLRIQADIESVESRIRQATKTDIENVIDLIQQVIERMDQRFEAVDRRFDTVESRLDKLGDGVAGVEMQMSGVTRWSERIDRDQLAILSTQKAQQIAIDNLADRITRLERRPQN